ncbi:hypothetical protein KP002_01335 [Geomonas subterranea]|uniref:hypothetical protein n=1 Tax=Geomonas subterranea TaxID=2847989 RepID=UPI001C47420D|nr:hypothetical protein [Geomonas subterranea]QXM09794.1 hypothetical protein KP002_01335 [Geomonas subterranea]
MEDKGNAHEGPGGEEVVHDASDLKVKNLLSVPIGEALSRNGRGRTASIFFFLRAEKIMATLTHANQFKS